MSGNPYAANKAILHLERLHTMKHGRVKTMPVQVHFVISDLCNQHCSFCSYRMPGYTEIFAEENGHGGLRWNPNRMIGTPKAKRIIDELRYLGAKAIQFTGGGEPTVHSDCAEIMMHAKDAGLDTALVTNGAKLDDALLEAIMATTWVRVSIDHAHRGGYAAMRSVKPAVFDRVLDNVRRIVAARRGKSPTIGIGFVVNKDNYIVIEEAVRLYKSLGVDNVRLSAVFQSDNEKYFEEFEEQAIWACDQATRLTDDKFMVINNFDKRFGDLLQGNPDYKTCHYQHMTTYIGADLNVYRCCVTSYTNYGKLGNLGKKDFKEIWFGDHADDSAFDARDCPRCQFNDKNKAINAILNPPGIEHGNFV